ncbi:hypothetical protein QTN24_20130 [Cupriavidus sp. SZY C1]|uniref:hypothetical protein n=1 Tax=Cupriavidus sp. SZY C1 TaxID=3055037 RepID=UPI0028B9DDD5|nr:hypothetical protein [Cupriavidus sp. SZY C1]MDT6963816.1 hypothetical protein [Cupriavidus sp. SZY C1]
MKNVLKGSNMNRKLIGILLFAMTWIAGCDAVSSVPTYGGLSIAGFNYTPYNLSRFVITDEFGNSASGGGDLPPGSGAGSLSCCYNLKGTDFTVKWVVYDADEAIRSLDAGERIQTITKTAKFHLPATEIKGEPGMRVLGLHFYPDDSLDFEFRTDLRGTRIFYSDIDSWLFKKQGKTFNSTMEDWVAFRRTARIAGQGWIKYRLTDTQDLQQYVYYTLFVNPNFDAHPAIQQIIADTKDKPGAFGAAMENLAAPIVKELKQNTFKQAATGANHD